jgi:hypothetical protein
MFDARITYTLPSGVTRTDTHIGVDDELVDAICQELVHQGCTAIDAQEWLDPDDISEPF